MLSGGRGSAGWKAVGLSSSPGGWYRWSVLEVGVPGVKSWHCVLVSVISWCNSRISVASGCSSAGAGIPSPWLVIPSVALVALVASVALVAMVASVALVASLASVALVACMDLSPVMMIALAAVIEVGLVDSQLQEAYGLTFLGTVFLIGLGFPLLQVCAWWFCLPHLSHAIPNAGHLIPLTPVWVGPSQFPHVLVPGPGLVLFVWWVDLRAFSAVGGWNHVTIHGKAIRGRVSLRRQCTWRSPVDFSDSVKCDC